MYGFLVTCIVFGMKMSLKPLHNYIVKLSQFSKLLGKLIPFVKVFEEETNLSAQCHGILYIGGDCRRRLEAPCHWKLYIGGDWQKARGGISEYVVLHG